MHVHVVKINSYINYDVVFRMDNLCVKQTCALLATVRTQPYSPGTVVLLASCVSTTTRGYVMDRPTPTQLIHVLSVYVRYDRFIASMST